MGFDALPQVLQCIGDLSQGANDIMNGLTAYVRIISKSVPGNRVTVLEAMELVESSRSNKMKGATMCLRKEKMTTVVWTMPLGLPSVQLYHKVKQKQIMTSMQSVYISDPNAPAEGEHAPVTQYRIDGTLDYQQSTRKSRHPLSRLSSFTA